ncbi:hypothetical protein [Aliivibrio fischeri]|uniref:hypothetical protein n=1 Tax=Aliivibrio fischeri TaxID=668 RepID=UPI00080E48DE|nr:hypothetical protein [Aliivibrio fischeri]OCH37375.1 hypothetical protein A6E02_18675 [Aliivibrio fischeri]
MLKRKQYLATVITLLISSNSYANISNSLDIKMTESFVSTGSIDASEFILFNLDGVDVQYSMVREDMYFNDVNVKVYSDKYMGNAFVTNYKGHYLGYIVSIFGTYEINFDEMGNASGVRRLRGNNCRNNFTYEELEIISEKSHVNTIWSISNQFGDGEQINMAYLYNQKSLTNGSYTVDDLKRYYAISTSVMQQTFINNGFNYIIKPQLEDVTDGMNDTFSDFNVMLINESPKIQETLNILKRYDYSLVALGFVDSIENHSYLTGNYNAVDALTAWEMNAGELPYEAPQSVAHEFFHSLTLDHSQYSASYVSDTVALRQSGGYLLNGLEQFGGENCSVGSLMSYSDNRTLAISNPNLLFPEPNTESQKYGDYYYSNSYNTIKQPINNFNHKIEEFIHYSEYEKYPKIKMREDGGTQSFINYNIQHLTDDAYSDIEFYDNSTIEVVEDESTYVIGGSGRKYDKLTLKITNELENVKYVTRYIENMKGTYDENYNPVTLTVNSHTYIDKPRYQITIKANDKNTSDMLVDTYEFRKTFGPIADIENVLLINDIAVGARENGEEFNAKVPYILSPGEKVVITGEFDKVINPSPMPDFFLFKTIPRVLYQGYSEYPAIEDETLIFEKSSLY